MVGVAAKSMHQEPEAALGVSEAFGGLPAGEAFDDKCSQRLVLPVGGGLWFEKEALERC